MEIQSDPNRREEKKKHSIGLKVFEKSINNFSLLKYAKSTKALMIIFFYRRKITRGWNLVIRADDTVFGLRLRSEILTHVRPFRERLHVLVPGYLHANRITLHAIEVGILGRGAVKELAPEQLSVQRKRRHRLLYLKQYR